MGALMTADYFRELLEWRGQFLVAVPGIVPQLVRRQVLEHEQPREVLPEGPDMISKGADAFQA